MYGALNQEIIGSHTELEWLDLLATWNWLCFYCGEPIQRGAADPKHEATKDHMTPISRGGVNFIGNIVPACLHCNQLKGDKTVEEFRAERAWVLREKSTGNTPYAAPQNFPQDFSDIPTSPTVEIAAMWKRVIDDVAAKKNMRDQRTDTWWQQRREMLKAQAAGLKRMRLENAGQLTLPIFGDEAPRKLMETEPAALAVSRGMHVAEPVQRKA